MPMIMPREKNMAPDRNGLFTIKQVAVLAADRNLMTFDTENANVCEVVHGIYRDRIQIPAYNEGSWHPIHIFRAFQEAVRGQWYGVDPANKRIIKSRGEFRATAKISNPGGLNEILIANVIGADGVKAYSTRKGIYRPIVAGDRTSELDALFNPNPPENIKTAYKYRRALHALDDAGLIDMVSGPKAGIGTATFEWTELAMLQPPKLSAEDADALNALVA